MRINDLTKTILYTVFGLIYSSAVCNILLLGAAILICR
jgi:hypothetical protein